MQRCRGGNLPSKYRRRCYSGRVQRKYDTPPWRSKAFCLKRILKSTKVDAVFCKSNFKIPGIIHLSMNQWILNIPSIVFAKYFINIFSTLSSTFKLECHHFPSGLTQFQSLIFFQACMAGIVFAKFTKPTMRAETILFSKNALITVRNGSMYLVCRIADLR